MEGRISKGAVAVGIVVVVVGGILAWAWLGPEDPGEVAPDAAAPTGELADEQERILGD